MYNIKYKMNNKSNANLWMMNIFQLAVIIICISCFMYVTIVWAWCSDDAYHAYTMSKNLINGQGFTPTVGKRVNVSTCPLWTIIVTLVMWVCPDEYYTGLVLNLFFSWSAFIALIFYVYQGNHEGKKIYSYRDQFAKTAYLVLATSIMCMSKSFISYTSSGLENSLLFFLSTIFIIYFFNVTSKDHFVRNKGILPLAFIEGLIIFARMDMGLVFIPMCLYAGLCTPFKSIKQYLLCCLKRLAIAIVGIAPFIIWELFSLIYYGSLVPNTALAKLNTGFPKYQYYERGIAYYVVTFEWDCLVLLLPIFYCLISFCVCLISSARKKMYPHVFMSVGILLYMGYIVSIGGDFMKGRHFTVLFWISIVSLAILFCSIMKNSNMFFGTIAIMAVLLLTIGYWSLIDNKIITNPAGKCANDIQWVYTDERDVYFAYTGLPNVVANGKNLIWDCQHRGIQWYHGVDWYEERLYDPLLSRLPAYDDDDKWVVGHMSRVFPEGYQETLDTGVNCIENKSLHVYYDYIYEVISGDIWSIQRLKTVLHLNLGDYDYLIEEYIQANN